MHREDSSSRRRFLSSLALGTVSTASLFARGAFADQLVQTPAQMEGPFYPNKLPLDTDNDLLILNDGLTPGVGTITHLSGRILDKSGSPVRNAVVEIWQVDGNGVYLHSGSANSEKRDPNFQGFGRFLTGSTGEYYFRTVKPIPYPGRTAHIHYQVKVKGQQKFTTQCYVKGEPGNEKDGIFKTITDPKLRAAILVDFAPIPKSKIGELAARWDVVLGFTPAG